VERLDPSLLHLELETPLVLDASLEILGSISRGEDLGDCRPGISLVKSFESTYQSQIHSSKVAVTYINAIQVTGSATCARR